MKCPLWEAAQKWECSAVVGFSLLGPEGWPAKSEPMCQKSNTWQPELRTIAIQSSVFVLLCFGFWNWVSPGSPSWPEKWDLPTSTYVCWDYSRVPPWPATCPDPWSEDFVLVIYRCVKNSFKNQWRNQKLTQFLQNKTLEGNLDSVSLRKFQSRCWL